MLVGSWKALAAGGVALACVTPLFGEPLNRLWQRYQIENYREIAAELVAKQKFHEAEQTLARALEHRGAVKLDLEQERLVAKTSLVNADLQWSGKVDDTLDESDFLVLEAMQAHAGDLPAHAWTLNNHAVFIASNGDPKRALPLVEQALTQSPGDARIHVTLGNVRWDLDQLDAATSAYLAALARDPYNVSAHFNLALIYETLGNTNAAITELQRVLELRPDDAAREVIARLERVRG